MLGVFRIRWDYCCIELGSLAGGGGAKGKRGFCRIGDKVHSLLTAKEVSVCIDERCSKNRGLVDRKSCSRVLDRE